MSSKIANSTAAHKTICKVCFDAGQGFEEYSSHRVKDINGNVICPTLLSQNCRGCSKSGHTIKFCPLILQREKQNERQSRIEAFQLAEEKKQKTAVPKRATVVGGGFAALAESSKKKVKKQVKVKEVKEAKEDLYPQLSQSDKVAQSSTATPSTVSYSDALKAVKPVVVAPKQTPIVRRVNPAYKCDIPAYTIPNWADIVDSDEED